MAKDKKKLLELRKKQSNKVNERHAELIDSNEAIKSELHELFELINGREPFNAEELINQVESLKEVFNLKEDIATIVDAINSLDTKVVVDNDAVALSIDNLSEKIAENSVVDQDPKNFTPVRRVIKVGNKFVFDDNLTPNGFGGGGGGSSIPMYLIRNNEALAVVNPDGTPIAGGGGGGGNVVITSEDGVNKAVVNGDGAVSTATYDGADNNAGSTVDSIIDAGAEGTMSAKLRRISQDISDLKNSALPSTNLYNDRVLVTSAGTAQQLGSGFISSVTIKALSSNTGVIYVGQYSVSSGNGFELAAGETVSMDVASLDTVFIDASDTGDGVTYIGVS